MQLKDLIQKQAALCDRGINELSDRLHTYPDGELRSYPNGSSYTRWVWYKGRGRDYLPKTKPDLAKALAEKALTRASLHDLYAEKQACDNYLQALSKNPADAVEQLVANADICTLLHRTSSDEFLQNWMSEPYQKNPNYPEGLTVSTVTGEKVRSKSEAMCVQLLHSMQIPFHYEQEHLLSGRAWYPDFTVLRPKDHAIILIEIFGMMSDPDYKRKTSDKISSYIAHGYIPQVNLLCFFETAGHPLDMEFMQYTLRHFLCT